MRTVIKLKLSNVSTKDYANLWKNLSWAANLTKLWALLILWALRVISIEFLLVISMLCTTEWSCELWTWSHKTNLIDTLSTSPHFFCRKWIGATNENSNFDLRAERVNCYIVLFFYTNLLFLHFHQLALHLDPFLF